jgi:hypothetical protein
LSHFLGRFESLLANIFFDIDVNDGHVALLPPRTFPNTVISELRLS